jgi:methylmalonyl-CoA mutase C-terminal domain/subunit
MKKRIRVLIAKPGLDGHDLGAKVVARALRDAGIEVIYTGLHQTPEQIVASAVQEDVDVIGLSVLSGAHLTLTEKVMSILREQQIPDKRVVVGGVVPGEDIDALRNSGIDGIFPSGTRMDDIVKAVLELGSKVP